MDVDSPDLFPEASQPPDLPSVITHQEAIDFLGGEEKWSSDSEQARALLLRLPIFRVHQLPTDAQPHFKTAVSTVRRALCRLKVALVLSPPTLLLMLACSNRLKGHIKTAKKNGNLEKQRTQEIFLSIEQFPLLDPANRLTPADGVPTSQPIKLTSDLMMAADLLESGSDCDWDMDTGSADFCTISSYILFTLLGPILTECDGAVGGDTGDPESDKPKFRKKFAELKKAAQSGRIQPLMNKVKEWSEENGMDTFETLCELGHR